MIAEKGHEHERGNPFSEGIMLQHNSTQWLIIIL
jgi:hypothetical protein